MPVEGNRIRVEGIDARDWGRRNGAIAVQLGVDAFNADAIAFYRHLGFSTEVRRMTLSLRDGDAP